MSTVTNVVPALLTQPANVCQTIHDLTGTRTSDPATWPDYGVKSLVSSQQSSPNTDEIVAVMKTNLAHNVGERKERACSLSREAAPKGSSVRWRIAKSQLADLWYAIPSNGLTIYDVSWHRLMRKVNAEIKKRGASRLSSQTSR